MPECASMWRWRRCRCVRLCRWPVHCSSTPMHSKESARSLLNIPLDRFALSGSRFCARLVASLPFDIVPILSRERRKAPSEQKRNAEKIRDDDFFGPLADYSIFLPLATSVPPFLYHCKLQHCVQTVLHRFVRCLPRLCLSLSLARTPPRRPGASPSSSYSAARALHSHRLANVYHSLSVYTVDTRIRLNQAAPLAWQRYCMSNE